MERDLSPETFGVRSDLSAIFVDEQLIYSVLLVGGILALRWMLISVVRRGSAILTDGQRRMILRIRNIATGAMLVGMVVLWAPQLENFMLSIAAFAVAIVIASKELILCLAGGVLRSATGAFTVGDWIEIGPHSGEVVDIHATTTQMQEFDRVEFEHTGRLINVPNSLYLAMPVVNHSFRKRYIFHEFVITAEPMPNAESARLAIEAGLRDAAGKFADVAARYRDVLERRSSVVLPQLGPEVRIRTTDFAKLRFEARLFCPREQAGKMEQAAMRAFLDWVDAQPWMFVGVQPRVPTL